MSEVAFLFFTEGDFVSPPSPLRARARAALARLDADLMMSLTCAWRSWITSGDSLEGSDMGFGFDLGFVVEGGIGRARGAFLVIGEAFVSEVAEAVVIIVVFRFFLGRLSGF